MTTGGRMVLALTAVFTLSALLGRRMHVMPRMRVA